MRFINYWFYFSLKVKLIWEGKFIRCKNYCWYSFDKCWDECYFGVDQWMTSNSYALISYTDWLDTLVICECHIGKQKLKIVFCKNFSNLCRSVRNSFQPSIHKCIRRVILDLLIIDNPCYFNRRTECKSSVRLMTCILIRCILRVRVNSEVLLPFNADLVRVCSPHLYNSRSMRIGHVLLPSELYLFQRILKLRVMFQYTFPFRIHSLKMQKWDSPWMRVFPKLID